MNSVEINVIRNSVYEKKPLIHCITNPISINQCANAVLSAGARPIMAEHPLEVAEITQTASVLMLNIANITDVRMKSIKTASETAKKYNIPSVLDIVGISCSQLRRNYVHELLDIHIPTVIKGNYSEICALSDDEYRSAGVDSHSSATFQKTLNSAVSSAQKYNTVILASGKTDIVTDGKRVAYIHNGSPRLAEITGTGCMQGALTAVYLSASDGFQSAVTACTVMGICGELASCKEGTGSFYTALLDSLSLLRNANIEKYMRVEELTLEKI